MWMSCPSPPWWCVLPLSLATGSMRSRSSVTLRIWTHCNTLVPQISEQGDETTVCSFPHTTLKGSVFIPSYPLYRGVCSLPHTHIWLDLQGRVSFILTLTPASGGANRHRFIFYFNRLQTLVPDHNLIIASYDIVRNDIDFFK